MALTVRSGSITTLLPYKRSVLRACFVNDPRARATTEELAHMSELLPTSPIIEVEASQKAASSYLQNTL